MNVEELQNLKEFKSFKVVRGASVILSTRDVLRIHWPKESGAILCPVGVLFEHLSNWIVYCLSLILYVSSLDVEKEVLLILFAITVISITMEFVSTFLQFFVLFAVNSFN